MAENNNNNGPDERNERDRDRERRGRRVIANPVEIMQYLFHRELLRPNAAETNEQMIEGLKSRGAISTQTVENAMRTIPRGDFVLEDMLDEAYEDCPLRFKPFGFNISAPHMYAVCLEALDIQPGNSVLDIGSGCGHLTCLAGFIAGPEGKAHGLDLREDIVGFARENKKKIEITHDIPLPNVSFEIRNCFLPDLDERLWDRIHVGACTPKYKLIDLYNLLTPNGILVTPYADQLIKIVKDKEVVDDKFHPQVLADVKYSDLIVPSPTEVTAAQLALKWRRLRKVKIADDTFARDFGSLLNPTLGRDLRLIFQDGKSYYVHKLLMVIASPYIERLLIDPEHYANVGEISLPLVATEAVIMNMLTYVYEGKTDVVKSDLQDLLTLSKLLELDDLSLAIDGTLSSVDAPSSSSPSPPSPSSSSPSKKEGTVNPNATFTLPLFSNLSKRVRKLLNTSFCTDVVLVVEEKKINAHRLVLAARSTYFKSIFHNGMRESTQPEVVLPGFKYHVFLDFLKFIYSGDPSTISCLRSDDSFDMDDGVELEDVLEIANYFNEERLKNICEDAFAKSLDLENVSYLFQLATRFDAQQLRNVCMEFILDEKNFEAISKTKSFQEMERDLLVQLISKSIKKWTV